MNRIKTAASHIKMVATTVVVLIIVTACANIGSPEGGPRDYTPPRVTKTSPANGALDFKGNKVEITFDEIVQLKDQQSKVVVSPAQKSQPSIKNLGRKITVEFRDTLLPNTTYVIDFTNSIEDNNEGNVLDGYSYAFSTGDKIDSMQISGMVLRANDLEPMQHVLVGLHSNLNDTAFTTTPFERICRTNDRGQFTMRNLKPGKYHVFALNDMDGNYLMARTEDMAFCDSVIVPSVTSYTSQDTVFTFDHRVDTVVTATHSEYHPNNVLLCMFNENYKQQYLKTYQRLGGNRLYIGMGAPAKALPELRIISPERHNAKWNRLERNAAGDSLIYWLTDSSLIKSDSIAIEVSYMRTPPSGIDTLVAATDTLQFALRRNSAQLKQQEQLRKEREKRDKEISQLIEKRDKTAAAGKDATEIELDIAALRKEQEAEIPVLKTPLESTDIGVADSIAIKFDVPIDTIYNRRIHLRQMQADSSWVEIELPPMVKANSWNEMRYVIPMRLTPGGEYKLTLDSTAIYSIYNITNKALEQNLKVKTLEEYANLYFKVSNLGGKPAFVELLNGSDKPVMKSTVKANGEAAFENVTPGTYYARLTLDANGNGIWDTGNYNRHVQPEEVYYFPKPLKLRRNWDVEQAWDIYSLPLDVQKPDDVRRNKSESRNNLLNKTDNKKKTSDDEEEDEFNNSSFGRNAYSGNKYNDYRNQR